MKFQQVTVDSETITDGCFTNETKLDKVHSNEKQYHGPRKRHMINASKSMVI